MPILDPDGYGSWLTREKPGAAAQAVAAPFILRLPWESWAAPSDVIEDLCERPVYEYRTARLAVAGEVDVRVFYRHYYESDDVVVVEVTNR